MNKIALAIPIYNDFETMEMIIKDIELLEIPNVDFYIINNGSTDSRIAKLINELENRNVKKLFTHNINHNLGFGGGIKSALSIMPNEFIGWMPGNLKIKPIDLPPFIQHVFENLSEFEAFKAHRVSRSLLSTMKTIVANLLISIYFRKWLFDTGGTPTIVARKYLSSILKGPNDYTFEAFTTYFIRSKKVKLSRPDIAYHKRPFGTSHWQTGFLAEIKLLRAIIAQKEKWQDEII